MAMYAREQGDDGMDEDLTPWIGRTWSADLTLDEFPYFQYSGPDESDEVRRWMDTYGCDDIWTLPDHLRESATYRTDLVAVQLDHNTLRRRVRTVDERTMITREGWGQTQPRLRTFLNFRRDGPMSRDYYVKDHGLHGEPSAFGQEQSRRSFEWLTDAGFLVETDAGWRAIDTADVLETVHAVELKREAREWDTALEQASRADVYADRLWVAMSEPTADRALANTEAFREAGVGLITVSPDDVTVHVQSSRHYPGETYEQLSRPYCERWDLNERAVKRYLGPDDSRR